MDGSKPEGGPRSLVMFLESAPTGRVSTQGWELWMSTQCNSELLSHLLGAVPEEFHPRLPSAQAGWLAFCSKPPGTGNASIVCIHG